MNSYQLKQTARSRRNNAQKVQRPLLKDWIAYMNAWADQKPMKPTDGPFVFKSTIEYSETGITGDVKGKTRTFDTSGTELDLPDTATKAFIDIGLTNGILPYFL